jgi:phospholipid/cholesterol/gamma-HCH transport system substrate-binding protein
VGSVTRLSLDGRDPNRVVARIRTASDAPVRVDSVASLEPLGLTGVNYVQITAGDPRRPLLKDVTPQGLTPVIRSAPSSLDSLLQGGGTVLARTVEALDRANRLMSDRNIAAVSATFGNVEAVTGRLREQQQLFADLDRTVQDLNATSTRVSKLSVDADALINGEGRATLAKVALTADTLRATATDTRAAIARIAGPAGDFATSGLPQASRAVSSLQQAAENLDRLVGEVERNPRGLLSKAPARTVEVPP